MISLIQSGAVEPAATLTRDEEENRKRLTAFLGPSPPLMLLDNVHEHVASAALASILTTSVWKDRRLGKNDEQLELPVTSCFVLTGNNITLSSEITRRSVLIRLLVNVEDPSTRTGFRHPRLEAWVRGHRGALVAAVLTLGQAWIAAGRPTRGADAPVFGSFEEWADVVGGLLDVIGVPGLLDNRDQLFTAADAESGPIRSFLSDWWGQHGSRPVSAMALMDVARGRGLDIEAKSDNASAMRLGRLLARYVDRPYRMDDGVTLTVQRNPGRRNAVLWVLRREAGTP